MEKSIERIPTWSLGYIINGDAAGLNDDEIKMIDNLFHKQHIELVCPVENSKETGTQAYFSTFPFFGLPAEVEDCLVIYNI